MAANQVQTALANECQVVMVVPPFLSLSSKPVAVIS